MATASLAGHAGTITGTTELDNVDEIKEWDCDVEFDLMDATSMSSTNAWKEFVVGLKSGSGSLSAIGDTSPSIAGTQIASLKLDCGGAGALRVSGAAYLSNVTFKVAHDGLVEYGASFQFDGAVDVGTIS